MPHKVHVTVQTERKMNCTKANVIGATTTAVLIFYNVSKLCNTKSQHTISLFI